jgi:hemolysin III
MGNERFLGTGNRNSAHSLRVEKDMRFEEPYPKQTAPGITPAQNAVKPYTTEEEIGHAVTHGIGAALSIAALVLLTVRAALYAPPQSQAAYMAGFIVFGISLIILYLMSTLYHSLTHVGAKRLFAIIDHCSIFLLIAGTYTAFCLTVLRGVTGWTIFGVVWAVAVLGITLYAIFGSRIKIACSVAYILLGWLIVFAYEPMKEGLPSISLHFLATGGLCYTIGFIFYVLKKVKWTHFIFHILVLLGSIAHFFSVYLSI